MIKDDYLEEEWPEESPAEPEAPAEEEESDRGLYTYDLHFQKHHPCFLLF